MSRTAPKIYLNVEEREVLENWTRSGKSEQRFAFRAKIILAAEKGDANQEIARSLQTTVSTIGKWRNRFIRLRIKGLADAPRPGQPSTYNRQTELRVLEMLDQPVPKGFGVWSGPLLAKALGNVSVHQVWRILRKYKISLARRRSYCLSIDPEFASKAAAIVGLYLDPPENAIVLCVDEKPSIQALERAQGWLKMPDGKALTGFNHEYKRHGTTTLFAALEIVTGLVKTGHYKHHRRREFLDFMNEIVADYAEEEIHVILDNYKTHKPKHDLWLSRHPNVHLHYTPTHASWLNQVEIWFGILWKKSLRGTSFTSKYIVRKHIDNFTDAYNETASPFEWKAEKVYPGRLKHNYKDLCK